ncbi:hypothetical protein CE91St38_28900 [Desulfovibrionaceae bacterium]|jgi:hypothetical protein|nr:hypothetical protein CE91St38_28900 [Desulfovibrionaceae bacterium]GKI13499.1 hypothetical protein CE91St39_29530 [Desulfovibrionaceae bacterium]DAT56352.1 MAG TPA: hypothetical protein [Caudoviricetes sp.]
MAFTVLTRKYQEKVFRMDLTPDGQAYFLCKPLSATAQQELVKKVMAECGYDTDLAGLRILPVVMQTQIVGWDGLMDLNNEPLPFSPDMVAELCDVENAFMDRQYGRLKHIAREGRLEEEKN